MVEKINPMMADNNEYTSKYGFIKIRQLNVPNTNDKIPDSLNKFINENGIKNLFKIYNNLVKCFMLILIVTI